MKESFCLRTGASLGAAERKFRTAIWIFAITVCLASLIYSLSLSDGSMILMSLGSFIIVTVPFLSSKLCRFEMNTCFFVFVELYALGPLLGEVYLFYERIKAWDVILHTVGGFVFAAFGAHIGTLLSGERGSTVLMRICFAIAFSVTLSVLWEFTEYGADMLLGTDMQRDTLLSEISSYHLSNEMGVVESIKGIEDVTVNGEALGLDGYLDVGLHDTMQDMLVETAGAMIFALYSLFDKGRHEPIYKTA